MSKQAGETAPRIEGIDTQSGVLRVGGNPATYFRMLQMFCDTHANAALSLISNLGNGERQAAERIAHSINGVAANLGAEQLSELAATLEHAIAGVRETPEMIDAFAAGLAHTIAMVSAALAASKAAGDGAAGRPTSTEPSALDGSEAIAGLAALLDEHSGDTIDYLEQHTATLRSALGAAAFDTLSNAIDRFDFPAAQQVLVPHK